MYSESNQHMYYCTCNVTTILGELSSWFGNTLMVLHQLIHNCNYLINSDGSLQECLKVRRNQCIWSNKNRLKYNCALIQVELQSGANNSCYLLFIRVIGCHVISHLTVTWSALWLRECPVWCSLHCIIWSFCLKQL